MTLSVVPGPWYVGYVWTVTVRLRDPATCQPLRVAAGWSLWADFFTGPGAAAQRIDLTGVVASQARGNLVIPSATTKALTPGHPSDTSYPVHAVLGYTDPTGDHSLGVIYFLPLDPSAAGTGP